MPSREIVHWYPTTLVECACRLDKKPNLLVLIGFKNPCPCPECGYSAMAIGLRQTQIGVEIEVAWLPPKPQRKRK